MVDRSSALDTNPFLLEWYRILLGLQDSQPAPTVGRSSNADTYGAFEGLPEDLKQRLAQLAFGFGFMDADLAAMLLSYLENRNQQLQSSRNLGSLRGGGGGGGGGGGSTRSSGGTPSTSSTPTTIAKPNLPPGQGLDGLKVQVIGDSLMVGASDKTRQALTGAGASQVNVDAEVGRMINGSGEGKHMSPAEIRQSVEQSGANVVVLELGTNHSDYARFVPETMNELSKIQPPPLVVWVNTQTQRPGQSSYDASYYQQNADINRIIADEAAKRPNMVVADWSAIAGGPGINAGDGLHLTGAGNDAMANVILQTIARERNR